MAGAGRAWSAVAPTRPAVGVGVGIGVGPAAWRDVVWHRQLAARAEAAGGGWSLENARAARHSVKVPTGGGLTWAHVSPVTEEEPGRASRVKGIVGITHTARATAVGATRTLAVFRGEGH